MKFKIPIFLLITTFLSTFFAAALLGATPPDDILGQFLYFEEGPEDYLIFDDATSGEERDILGDIDPFTYTYSVTGANTATLVATYDPVDGDYDEWDLTYTADGKGTFVRREYKDNILEDTDTGGFQENTGQAFPPVDLIGARLEEAVELEDERFEFLTETLGREFEPGDVDPFSYIYIVTGTDTANIVATFKVDKWDDLDLTFETESTGTYVLQRYDDGLLKDEKRGDFSLDRNTQTVDLAVGTRRSNLIGDDFFKGSGARQSILLKTNRSSRQTVFAQVENDGVDDSFRVRASRGNREFEVEYFSTGPRRNVTSAITSDSGLSTNSLEHNESETFEVLIKPKRKRGRLTLGVNGASQSVDGAQDQVKVKVRKK